MLDPPYTLWTFPHPLILETWKSHICKIIRDFVNVCYYAHTGLILLGLHKPRALPWADIFRHFVATYNKIDITEKLK